MTDIERLKEVFSSKLIKLKWWQDNSLNRMRQQDYLLGANAMVDHLAAEYILVKKADIPSGLAEAVKIAEFHAPYQEAKSGCCDHCKRTVKIWQAFDKVSKVAALLVQGGGE